MNERRPAEQWEMPVAICTAAQSHGDASPSTRSVPQRDQVALCKRPPGAQAHCGRPRVDGVASPYACDRARGIFAGRQDGRMCTKGGLGGILTGQQDGRMCTKGGPGGPCRAGAWPHVHTFTEGRYRALKTRPSHPTITKTQVKKRKGLFKTQKKSFIGHLCDAGLCGTVRRGVVRCVHVCVRA